jgi:hypothetical protein
MTLIKNHTQTYRRNMQKQYKEKPYTAPRSWYNNTSSLLNIIAVLVVLNIFFGLVL